MLAEYPFQWLWKKWNYHGRQVMSLTKFGGNLNLDEYHRKISSAWFIIFGSVRESNPVPSGPKSNALTNYDQDSTVVSSTCNPICSLWADKLLNFRYRFFLLHIILNKLPVYLFFINSNCVIFRTELNHEGMNFEPSTLFIHLLIWGHYQPSYILVYGISVSV